MLAPTHLALTGDRFSIRYRLAGNESQARDKAEAICIEQTVEFPTELIPADDIRGQIFGRIESFRPAGDQPAEAEISYAVEITGYTLPQLINVIFGNISLQPGIRVERIDLPDSLLARFKGPRFGRAGWRRLLAVPERPLLCTALKPMGFSPKRLADMAYQFAKGGIDLIKDDHGLADQPFATFRERVQHCADAVLRANSETGFNCVYMPSINAPADRLVECALFAKRAGAGALVVMPGLSGLDSMRRLADDNRIALPIMSHPAFQGGFVTSPDQGISHFALFGQMARLAGADATIFPNFGGRFSFSRRDCKQIAAGAAVAMGPLKPIFPAPGGGMSLDRLPELSDLFGPDVIFLIGGGLYQQDPDLVKSSRYFRELIEKL